MNPNLGGSGKAFEGGHSESSPGGLISPVKQREERMPDRGTWCIKTRWCDMYEAQCSGKCSSVKDEEGSVTGEVSS